MRSVLLFLFVAIAALITNAAWANEKLIELDGKSHTPAAMFVQELLENAYSNIGYQVTYREVPLARSFVEANSGRLDGLRARIGTVADKYENLVKVPFNLLDFRLVLLADRRVCGVCNLKQLKHVVVPRGMKAFEDFHSGHEDHLVITEVTDIEQALSMLSEGKTQAIILPDISLPADYLSSRQHWIKQTLAVMPDYHYLNKKHQAVVPMVLAELEKMQSSGEISALRKKYNVPEVIPEFAEQNLGTVTGIAAVWFGFTDTADATYWKILSTIFNSTNSKFSHNVTNWKKAKQKFYDGEIDLLVGAYQFEVGDNMLRSEVHIDYEVPVHAYGKDEAKLKAQLAGEEPATVCYPLGYDFNQWLPDTIMNYEVPTFFDCERLFVAGKVDILMNYSLDLLPEITEVYPNVEVEEGKPLFVAFQDNERGRRLKHVFEKGFMSLIESGVLASYYPDKENFDRAKIVIESQESWAPAPVKKP